MKLRSKLTCGVAMVLATAGVTLATAPSAFADQTATIHPYADWSFGTQPGFDVTGIGATHPGFSDSVLCLEWALDSSGNTITDPVAHPGHFTGGVLDTEATLQDLSTVVPSCTLTDVGADFTGFNKVTATKHLAAISFSIADSVQPGIQAGAVSDFTITKAPGQTITTKLGTLTPSAPADQLGLTTVTYETVPTITKTKSALDSTACSDDDKAVDIGGVLSPIDSVTNTPFSYDISSYDPNDASNWNVATFHDCAQLQTQVPGKVIKVALAVSGAGTVSVAFHQAKTLGPQTWDTTLGKCKLRTVDAAHLPVDDAKNRVLTCKGGYGAAIPFQLDVRAPDPAHATDDVFGLLHAADIPITGTTAVIP